MTNSEKVIRDYIAYDTLVSAMLHVLGAIRPVKLANEKHVVKRGVWYGWQA